MRNETAHAPVSNPHYSLPFTVLLVGDVSGHSVSWGLDGRVYFSLDLFDLCSAVIPENGFSNVQTPRQFESILGLLRNAVYE